VEELREHITRIIIMKYGDRLKLVMRRTAYQERSRIKNQPWKADPGSDRQFWKKVQQAVADLPDDSDDHIAPETLQLLDRIIHRYAEEIVGNFNIKTFRFARRFLTAFFSTMFNAANGSLFGNRRRLHEKLIVKGEVEKLRTLFNKGVVVVLPTHFSNLDSIMIGYAIDEIIGLPAFTYGAGLNLYDSEIVGYFMNRLGAYRVDRRKKNPLYIEALKSMSSLSIMQGVNSLFFPGGTRSRSGSLEGDLKQGLLNSLVEAQRQLFQQGSDRKIIVVPFVFNYHFVLEADHLITQHLNYIGKESFVRVKDDFQSNTRILRFLWRIFSQRSEIYLSVGQPMDIMGNVLNEDGESLDKHGKVIDLKRYFMTEGEVTFDQQREKVYTKYLSEAVIGSYKKYNIVLSSHIVAFCAFLYFERVNSGLDIFGLIKLPEDGFVFDEDILMDLMSQVMALLENMVEEGKVRTSFHKKYTAKEVLDEGITNLGVYHASSPLMRDKSGSIISESFKTLFYYHNRLKGYDLEDMINWDHALLQEQHIDH
jgi:glycerol-3-phosphate O-acyltransferase